MVENYTKDLKESVYHGAIVSALAVDYFAANQGRLLERCFIQGRDIYNKTLKESGVSR